MSTPVFILLGLNFALIGSLPRFFFRQGRRNFMWWLTAAPFFVCALGLLLGVLGLLVPWGPETGLLGALREVFAVLLSSVSIGLIAFTAGTHRVRIALWHQQDDAPESIVTQGAYEWIRHPFYAAFVLALIAAAIALPHPWTLLTLVYGTVMLDRTAAREERRLAGSELGDEYRAYIERTGRFLPRLGRRETASFVARPGGHES